jgi:small subunit ribosomal protein S5
MGGEQELGEIVVKVKRCAKVMKGGKRFSFSALVVAGDRKGRVGIGLGKAKEVPFAIGKGVKEASHNLVSVPLKDNTIPHLVYGKFRSTTVLLRPACKGTGIIAGAPVRAVLEMAGVKDVLTKVFGSTNPTNAVKATLAGLQALRSKASVEAQRGVRIG